LREAATSINDIANNLLRNYRKSDDDLSDATNDCREPMLVSPVLLQLLAEKKYQFQHLPVIFDDNIGELDGFSWITIQPNSFKRMISNIINNAVDAFDQKEGKITLYVDTDDHEVRVTIEDNGKGMSPELKQKVIDQTGVTEGRTNGPGIGLAQVRHTLQNNQGQWKSIQINKTISLTNSAMQKSGLIKKDAIFVDDEQVLLDGFRMVSYGKRVDTYQNPNEFLEKVEQYHRDTKIMLDQNFTNYPKKGMDIALQLIAMGFNHIYLLSGGDVSTLIFPSQVKPILKTDMAALDNALNE